MKVLQVCYFDIQGGAPRAAYRIHHALRSAGIDSRMCVNRATARDWTVRTLDIQRLNQVNGLRSAFAEILPRLLGARNHTTQSCAVLPSRWPSQLNTAEADVIHLHWLGEEMMSIADIASLRQPVVWTLHDMWAFCGAEHYTDNFRWRDGYSRNNRPGSESGFDLNRWTWQRKMKHWRRPMHIVTPGQWMADCARQSLLMKDWTVTVIPYAIDTEEWRPIDKAIARKLLRLPADVPLLLFGASGGEGGARKGFDLLKAALNHLNSEIPDLHLAIFGQTAPKEPLRLGFPLHYAGHLNDNLNMCLYYSAADVVVVPSRQDNYPLVVIEANACGAPVVAFRVSGMANTVDHGKTGYLAEPFDTEDLARGIHWVLACNDRRTRLSARTRQDAVAKFSYPVVSQQYRTLYEKVIQS
jgi:glycosyltransferase involved in cell wall biosynthesis